MGVTISQKDIEAYRKVLAYYLYCDAFSWCRENNLECDEFLAQNMASTLMGHSMRNGDYWAAFASAYENCSQFLL